MGQVAAHAALVADADGGDPRETLGQRGTVGAHVGRKLGFAVRGHGADLQAPVVRSADPMQLSQPRQ